MNFRVGEALLTAVVEGDFFHGIGQAMVGNTLLRNPAARWTPWFDTYDGDIFNRFKFRGLAEGAGGEVRVRLAAISDIGYPFRERRDSSGDLCFHNRSFNAPPATADLDMVFHPAAAKIGGRNFEGFSYHFEYRGPAIHRLLDRGTWEIGGNLDDVNLVCRNWLTPPRLRIGRETVYSTAGLDKWAALLPGNMWARWSLLPGFDMQYGRAGILVGRYCRVSLIRTVIESNADEDAIRYNDFHWFEQSGELATNPKTILWCPERIGHTEAVNLWAALQDADRDMARRQFGIPEEEPPRLTFAENVWCGFHFDRTYESVLAAAAEFGADQIFIDVCWEQGQALKETLAALVPYAQQKGTILEKYNHRNMCCVLDFKVAGIHGGEAGLRRLCERAAAKGVKVISWMATHVHPHSIIVDGPQCAQEGGRDLPFGERFKHGKSGAIAAMESGRHPWTGYPNSCWTLNLNSPVYDYLKDCLLGVCGRTGLAGFLWDSVSNLGWWQVDYSAGNMRPQFDRLADLYAELTKNGLYLQPEGIVAFSSHSCCGLHGGDIYAGDLLPYSYDTAISLDNTSYEAAAILRGQAPAEMLFRCLAQRRAPSMTFHRTPRDEWDPAAVAKIKQYFAMYKAARDVMWKRTVLKDDCGVIWEGKNGERILWAFCEQSLAGARAVDLLRGETCKDRLESWRVYRLA